MVVNPETYFGLRSIQIKFADTFERVIEAEPRYISEVPNTSDTPKEDRQEIDEVYKTAEQDLFVYILKRAETDLHSAIVSYKALRMTTDLREPHDWYPYARLLKRKVYYHGGELIRANMSVISIADFLVLPITGPTNSGKTYHAIQRLKAADTSRGGGVFAGPLRLLALEVYEQLNRQGVYTSLMTGQEQRHVPFSTHVSCTIEMINLDKEYDVAVIDEIQMIADRQRGSAWTRALQGLRAKEIHVCGGLEVFEVVKNIVESMGDDFELRKYDRLSELRIADVSLEGDYSKIQPGDCVVAFSKADIFSIKKEIEQLTPYKCCTVYGQLPPETRSTQARLFNEDNTGYDVLVASDAIGMVEY
jgi:ATP-dependent RNA helicase SUPV3L1/SUV3